MRIMKTSDHVGSWLGISARSRKRLQIHVSGGCEQGRIEMSSGTRYVSAHDRNSDKYDQLAIVPREPWRRPTKEECAHLFSIEVPTDTSRAVGIIRRIDEIQRIEESTDNEEFERAIFEILHRKFDVGGSARTIGLTSNAPNLTTTTIDNKVDRYIGLHVDSWENVAINQRESSMNRICVNLGCEPRYFLFLPISIIEIADIMAEEIGPENLPDHRDVTELGRMFMELFPDVPVVRCELAPFEAYIAPTENVVHDGSSLGQHFLDRQFTILGHLAIGSIAG
jgi:hypothetical protein